MVHPVYQKRIESDVRHLISTSDEIDSIKHKGLRGAFRESSLGKLLQSYLPFGWDLGSGEVVDHLGKTSSEIDLLIYNRASLPPILYSESEGCYPVESCFYVFEIKTTSNASEIKGTIEKIKNLRKLEPLSSRRPITVYFAYNTDLKEKSEFERYTEYDLGFKDDPLISVLCIVGQGYWFHKKDPQSITWYFCKAEPNHFEVGLLLSGIINTLNKACSQPPFGYYVIDEVSLRKIIYYKDFVLDFDVPFDKIDFLNNGLTEHETGNYNTAIDLFSKFIQEECKLASFLVQRSIDSVKNGNYQAVIEYINKAINLDETLKNNYRIFYRRGIAYFQLSKIDLENSKNLVAKSIDDFDSSISLNPGNPELYYWLARAKLYIADLDQTSKLLTDILDLLEKALKLNPLYGEALILKGMTYDRVGEFSKAIDTYIKAMGIDPENDEILKYLAVSKHNLSLQKEPDSCLLCHEKMQNWLQGNYV